MTERPENDKLPTPIDLASERAKRAANTSDSRMKEMRAKVREMSKRVDAHEQLIPNLLGHFLAGFASLAIAERLLAVPAPVPRSSSKRRPANPSGKPKDGKPKGKKRSRRGKR